MKQKLKGWMYKGVEVWPADRNSSGIAWYARSIFSSPTLRADTKQGMRQLITHAQIGGGK